MPRGTWSQATPGLHRKARWERAFSACHAKRRELDFLWPDKNFAGRTAIFVSSQATANAPTMTTGTASSAGATVSTMEELRLRYGWLCAECYDQLEAAWKYGLEHRNEMIALDRDGNSVA